MAAKPMPSAEALRKLLDYNPMTGALTWLARPNAPSRWNTRYAGREAGLLSKSDGYRYISITTEGRKERYACHRIIWKMTHDVEPEQIDHINGVRDDNRLENLRNVPERENHKNIRLYRTNTSGVAGVARHGRGWVARIVANGDRLYLGWRRSFEDAVDLRKQAERRYGYHINHGRADRP